MLHAEASAAVGALPGLERFVEAPVLTTALRAGDEAAFRWLHEHWHARLMRYCFALTRGDAALADDVAQATYLRVIRHIRPLPDEAALWCWLALAARNAAVDLGRVGGRYRGALARFTAWLQGQPEGGEAAFAEAENALIAALEAALKQLSTEECELISDRYFRRVPQEETAARLGLTRRAVEGRLARVRQRLRELITAELRRQETP